MADIEISKITLRKGPLFDLPGQPVSLSPKEWSTPLDVAELAFADEGRLFVGVDPARNLPQSDRLEFPYQNIEIVGENSTEVFAQLHGAAMREDRTGFYSSTLAITPAWTTVDVGRPYALPTGTQGMITYAVFASSGSKVRSGEMTFSHNGTLDFIDEYDVVRGETGYDPASIPQIGLRMVAQSGQLLFQYRNTTGATMLIQFRH